MSSFAPDTWRAYYVCPLTELVKNKYAVNSHINLQHANSPNLGKYYLHILDILSEFRETRDLEYENTFKLRLHLQLASLYPRNITIRKADVFVQTLHFVNEEPKHWNCMSLWYVQWIWLPVLCINTKFQEWAKCGTCIEAEGSSM